jgi:hypothetical protein
MGFDARGARGTLNALCLAVIVGAGCGGSNNDVQISAQPLTGTISRQAWSIGTVTGQRDPYSAFGDAYSIVMYPVTFAACEESAPASVSPLVLMVPGVVGSYTITPAELSNGQAGSTGSTSSYPTWQPYPSGSGGTTSARNNVAAYFTSGLSATRGRIVISSVGMSAIAGGADLTFDAENHLNGQFQATLCP